VVNHKKVHRLYKEAGLQLQLRRKKKRPSHRRAPGEQPHTVNIRWAMDFMHDSVGEGRRFRLLAIVDLFSRECLLIEAAYSLRADHVVESLERLREGGSCPQVISVDNGSEFVSRKLDEWAFANGVQLDFINPGRPIENSFIESFNGRLRDECLNVNVFHSIEDARERLEQWRVDYNTRRPHGSLGDLTPCEYAERFRNLATEGKIPNRQAA